MVAAEVRLLVTGLRQRSRLGYGSGFGSRLARINRSIAAVVGEIATARSEIDGTGKVFVHGEFWDVKSQHKIAKGEQVRVTCVYGLTLGVEPVSKD